MGQVWGGHLGSEVSAVRSASAVIACRHCLQLSCTAVSCTSCAPSAVNTYIHIQTAFPAPAPRPPAGRSASNPAEAEAVVSAVEQLAAAGVALGRVGVICFFRAQVALVRSLLERCLPQLQREEQRRGQAAGPAGPCEPQPEAAAGDQGVVNLLVGSSRLGRRGAAGRASVGSGDGEAGEVAEAQAPQGIQVATVDSFQARVDPGEAHARAAANQPLVRHGAHGPPLAAQAATDALVWCPHH